MEPKKAFLYKPPTSEVIKKYQYIFDIKEPLKTRLTKVLFDKVIALIFLYFHYQFCSLSKNSIHYRGLYYS